MSAQFAGEEPTYPRADHAGYLRDCYAELHRRRHGKEPPIRVKAPDPVVAESVAAYKPSKPVKPVALSKPVVLKLLDAPRKAAAPAGTVPADSVLVADIAAGLSHLAMAERYDVTADQVRVQLDRIGLWQLRIDARGGEVRRT